MSAVAGFGRQYLSGSFQGCVYPKEYTAGLRSDWRVEMPARAGVRDTEFYADWPVFISEFWFQNSDIFASLNLTGPSR